MPSFGEKDLPSVYALGNVGFLGVELYVWLVALLGLEHPG